MKIRYMVLAAGASALLAFVLAGCGNSGASEPEAAQEAVQEEIAADEAALAEEAASNEVSAAEASLEEEVVEEDRGTPYQGFEARDAGTLFELMDRAIDEAHIAMDSAAAGMTVQSPEEIASEFAEANSSYREGRYYNATAAYEAILIEDPMHFGSNVNLTLALLQNAENERAVVQSMKCVYLFPDDPGCLLNAQVAATARGYTASDIMMVLDALLSDANGSSSFEVLEASENPGLKASYEYNNIWNRIDTDHYSALLNSSDAGSSVYDGIATDMEYLAGDNPDDPDTQQLNDYIAAVGTWLDTHEGTMPEPYKVFEPEADEEYSDDGAEATDEGAEATDDTEIAES